MTRLLLFILAGYVLLGLAISLVWWASGAPVARGEMLAFVVAMWLVVGGSLGVLANVAVEAVDL